MEIRNRTGRRRLAASLIIAAMLVAALTATGGANERLGPSGLPLPRFVSLKSDRINVRVGPGQDYRVSWVFTRAGLPVEITAESGNWRRIRDSEGDEGWIFHSLLSGRRTALVAPWADSEPLALKRSAEQSGDDAALLHPGVLVDVERCDGRWCRVSVRAIGGWMPQQSLWGVYPDETMD